MGLRGQRAKRKLIESERRSNPHALWRENLAAAEKGSDRRAALLEAGRDRGWVGPKGQLLDPNEDPKTRAHGELNADIRARAGRS
jgi:hypothetical protein